MIRVSLDELEALAFRAGRNGRAHQIERRAAGDWVLRIDGTPVAWAVLADDAHEFLPVRCHPDDDECTHREDGTDATYCGQTRAWHDGRPES